MAYMFLKKFQSWQVVGENAQTAKRSPTTWRIISVTEQIVTPIYKPWIGHLQRVPQTRSWKGTHFHHGPWLLTTYLRVLGWSSKYILLKISGKLSHCPTIAVSWNCCWILWGFPWPWDGGKPITFDFWLLKTLTLWLLICDCVHSDYLDTFGIVKLVNELYCYST